MKTPTGKVRARKASKSPMPAASAPIENLEDSPSPARLRPGLLILDNDAERAAIILNERQADGTCLLLGQDGGVYQQRYPVNFQTPPDGCQLDILADDFGRLLESLPQSRGPKTPDSNPYYSALCNLPPIMKATAGNPELDSLYEIMKMTLRDMASDWLEKPERPSGRNNSQPVEPRKLALNLFNILTRLETEGVGDLKPSDLKRVIEGLDNAALALGDAIDRRTIMSELATGKVVAP